MIQVKANAAGAAVGACLRKPTMLCSGVLTNRKPFDPAWGQKTGS